MFDIIIKSMNTELENNEQLQNYINTLNEDEKLVFQIAYEHLQSSFNILKSVGYNNYNN